jgi:O-acetyl-ADP-ribose deacetylase
MQPTEGDRLKVSYVIHTAGQVRRGSQAGEDELLASCYRNALQLAAEHGIRSIAFPSISTGAYRFPDEGAVPIAANLPYTPLRLQSW